MKILAEARNYALVGMATNAFNFGLFALFFDVASLPIFAATACAYLVAISFSYVATNVFVFPRRRARPAAARTMMYVAFIVLSAVFQSTATTLAYHFIGHQHFSWLIGALTAGAFNFWGLRRFVFVD